MLQWLTGSKIDYTYRSILMLSRMGTNTTISAKISAEAAIVTRRPALLLEPIKNNTKKRNFHKVSENTWEKHARSDKTTTVPPRDIL